jgi:FkbM family methyltransferase
MSGQVLIDVGANRGQSIDAMRLYHRDTPIHAFEPALRLADRLSKRFAGDHALTLHRVGLADRNETCTLFTPIYRGYGYDGLASFDRDEAAGWLNAQTLAGFDPAALTLDEAPCTLARLDDFDLAPAFIKLDVQGYERAALLGGEATLRRHEPVVMIENNAGADVLLTSWGWRRAAVLQGAGLCEGAQGALNTLYLSPERANALRAARVLVKV